VSDHDKRVVQLSLRKSPGKVPQPISIGVIDNTMEQDVGQVVRWYKFTNDQNEMLAFRLINHLSDRTSGETDRIVGETVPEEISVYLLYSLLAVLCIIGYQQQLRKRDKANALEGDGSNALESDGSNALEELPQPLAAPVPLRNEGSGFDTDPEPESDYDD
jgi:hypothetical protein